MLERATLTTLFAVLFVGAPSGALMSARAGESSPGTGSVDRGTQPNPAPARSCAELLSSNISHNVTTKAYITLLAHFTERLSTSAGDIIEALAEQLTPIDPTALAVTHETMSAQDIYAFKQAFGGLLSKSDLDWQAVTAAARKLIENASIQLTEKIQAKHETDPLIAVIEPPSPKEGIDEGLWTHSFTASNETRYVLLIKSVGAVDFDVVVNTATGKEFIIPGGGDNSPNVSLFEMPDGDVRVIVNRPFGDTIDVYSVDSETPRASIPISNHAAELKAHSAQSSDPRPMGLWPYVNPDGDLEIVANWVRMLPNGDKGAAVISVSNARTKSSELRYPGIGNPVYLQSKNKQSVYVAGFMTRVSGKGSVDELLAVVYDLSRGSEPIFSEAFSESSPQILNHIEHRIINMDLFETQDGRTFLAAILQDEIALFNIGTRGLQRYPRKRSDVIRGFYEDRGGKALLLVQSETEDGTTVLQSLGATEKSFKEIAVAGPNRSTDMRLLFTKAFGPIAFWETKSGTTGTVNVLELETATAHWGHDTTPGSIIEVFETPNGDIKMVQKHMNRNVIKQVYGRIP